jgi:hypothetical protein
MMFMIKYAYSFFYDTYFSFYHGRTMKMLSLMCIRERIVGFIVTEVISRKGEFHFSWALCNS